MIRAIVAPASLLVWPALALGHPEGGPGAPASDAPLAAPAGAATGSSLATVDVMVYYTTEARVAAGGKYALEADVHAEIEELNETTFPISQVGMRARLVHLAELGGFEIPGQDWLANFKSSPMIAAERDVRGGDLVVLVTTKTSNGTCEKADQNSFLHPDPSAYAFSNVAVQCLDSGKYHFAHALGHTMGLNHDAAAPSDGVQFYPYSEGHRVFDGSTGTIMSMGLWREPLFSNPSVYYSDYIIDPYKPNYQMGSSAANSALSLNQTRELITGFRPQKTLATSDLGGGWYGSNGFVTVDVTAPIQPGAFPAKIRIDHSPASMGLLLVGTTPAQIPLTGGTLQFLPQAAILLQGTGTSETIELVYPYVGFGPGHPDLYLQVVFEDGAKHATSDALVLHTP